MSFSGSRTLNTGDNKKIKIWKETEHKPNSKHKPLHDTRWSGASAWIIIVLVTEGPAVKTNQRCQRWLLTNLIMDTCPLFNLIMDTCPLFNAKKQEPFLISSDKIPFDIALLTRGSSLCPNLTPPHSQHRHCWGGTQLCRSGGAGLQAEDNLWGWAGSCQQPLCKVCNQHHQLEPVWSVKVPVSSGCWARRPRLLPSLFPVPSLICKRVHLPALDWLVHLSFSLLIGRVMLRQHTCASLPYSLLYSKRCSCPCVNAEACSLH